MSSHKFTQARPVYVVDGTRTPFLKARNATGPFKASDLAVYAVRELFARLPIQPTDIDEVITGCMMPAADEANIARVISLRLGCGKAVPAWTVQRNCASGMQALDSAFKDIAGGRHDLVLAGGTEAMSRAPVLYSDQMVNWLGQWAAAKTLKQRLQVIRKFKLKNLTPVIALLLGLTDPIVNLSMGQTAEILAYKFGITRKEMDEFAVQSHQRVAQALAAGNLKEIVPIYDSKGNYYVADDGVRADSSAEKLATLKPFFDKKFGNVTPGNSSQVTDGAAFLILASAEAVKKHQLPVLGEIKDVEWAGVEPSEMGLGPVHASVPILQRNQLQLADVDYWEINEAFSAQVLACLKAFADKNYCQSNFGLPEAVGEIDQNRLNIDGGAVALGHPVGASGARIVLHLLEVLKRQQAKRGIASICIGGGQGGAMLIENTNGVIA